VLGLTSPLVIVTAAVVVHLLPGPRPCLSFDCGPSFDSGAVGLFGDGNLTLSQTLLTAASIWAAAWLLARAVIGTKMFTSAGVATVVLALIIGWFIPSHVVGPSPSVACSSPDAGGHPVPGRCITGNPPLDNQFGVRLLVLAGGLTVLVLARIGDLARSHAAPLVSSDL
jgi:hypothetical protein